MKKIGVLAVQGDFAEHCSSLRKLGVEPIEVRLPRHLENLEGLIIPGGESTTFIRLMNLYGLTEAIKEKAQSGMALWGTCAGLIILAREVAEDSRIATLGLIDVIVRRNAYGRQVDSFEADIPFKALGDVPFHAVFIRAPVIDTVGKDVEVLATLPRSGPVAAKQGNIMVTSFHPELTNDHRVHTYFLRLAGTETNDH